MREDESTLTNAEPPFPERAGKYRVTGRIGQGGMGVVFRAVDEDLGRTVAIKFLPPEMRRASDASLRFLREAQAASALDHVNIGSIFAVEETEHGRRFIVMAYYEGRNLSERMADKANPLRAAEALSIAVQVARGLAEAHAHGIVHRDIKPSNIMLTSQGVVKIVDFGLAAMTGAEPLTRTDARLGTPAYMSPEQANGEAVDARADVWALGAVLLEMLTGKRAFSAGSVPAVLYQVVHAKPAMLDTVRQPVQGILAKALEKDPARRWQSATELLRELEAVAPRSVQLKRGPTTWRSRGVALCLLAAVLAVGGTAYWKFFARPPIAGAPSSATAFGQYKQALELMKRWDKQDNLERATKILVEITKADPSFALAFARLAEANRLQFALTRNRAALEAAEANAERALGLNAELAPVQVVWGRVQALRGNNDLAMSAFGRAVRTDPNDADAQLAIARQYERLGRLEDAESAFRRACTLEPEGIAAHDFYANFLYRQGRPKEAVEEWRTVIRIAPDNAAVLVNLGAALADNGRFKDAIPVYQDALRLKPTAMGWNNLGTAYAHLGDNTKAIDAYHKAISISGNDYLFHGNLAQTLQRVPENEQEAKKVLSRAIELAEGVRKENPRDALANRALAEYYARSHNRPLAEQRIETALALAPKSPEIRVGEAVVYMLLGKRKNALEAAQHALKMGFPLERIRQHSELQGLLADLGKINSDIP